MSTDFSVSLVIRSGGTLSSASSGFFSSARTARSTPMRPIITGYSAEKPRIFLSSMFFSIAWFSYEAMMAMSLRPAAATAPTAASTVGAGLQAVVILRQLLRQVVVAAGLQDGERDAQAHGLLHHAVVHRQPVAVLEMREQRAQLPLLRRLVERGVLDAGLGAVLHRIDPEAPGGVIGRGGRGERHGCGQHRGRHR